MSLIGPRPALWNQEDLMAWRDRFGASQIRPGLSGWAQVNGRDYLSRDLEKKARNGMTVILPQDPGLSGECRVYGESGEFLALGKLTGRKLETVKSFFSV